MLTFRNTSIVFLVLMTLFSVLGIFWNGGFVFLGLILLGYIVMLVFGSVFVCSGFYVKVFCKEVTTEKKIALSFDDGPDAKVTPKVLDLLKENNIKGAFFCIGEKVADNQELMMSMAGDGHIIGNHSYGHSSFFDLWSSRQMMEDVSRAEDIIALATGKRPKWFRPPFGVTNPVLAKTVARKGYRVIGWSIRSLDTSIKDPEKIMARISKKWHPGAIILLHDTDEKVLAVISMIIDYAAKEGYRMVGVDEYSV
jgi:peptidoglycan/xylan/chitin deacetylase (PgdA/CDA1 family)